MRFDRSVTWAGFDFTTRDDLFPNVTFEKRSVKALPVSYPFVRFKGLEADLIVRDVPLDKMPVGKSVDELLEVFLITCRYRIGERPVVLAYNNSVVVNISISDEQKFKDNVEQWVVFIKEVLRCDKIAPVITPVSNGDYDTVEEFILPALLYIPTHDGTPALWLDAPNNIMVPTSCMRMKEMTGLYDIPKRIKSQVAEFGNDIEVMSIPDTNIHVFYNSRYQHFNGSLADAVLFMPVIVLYWWELGTSNFDKWCDDWKDYSTQNDFELRSTTVLESNEVSAGNAEEVYGEWVCKLTAEPEPFYVKLCEFSQMDIAEKLAVMAVKEREIVFEVLETGNDIVNFYEFKPYDGTKILGHTMEIAQYLIDKLKDNGLNADNAEFIK